MLALHADNTEAVKAGPAADRLDPATADVNLRRPRPSWRARCGRCASNISPVDEARREVAAGPGRAVQRAQNDFTRRQRRRRRWRGLGRGSRPRRRCGDHRARRAAASRKPRAQARARCRAPTSPTIRRCSPRSPRYRRAAIARGHMHIIAPVDGVVAQRTVQLGQQVAAGTPLMAVVPLRQRVDRRQLQRNAARSDMRVGQPVTITADIYGGDVVYHGQVARPGRGQRQRLRAAAAAERQRQLDQDRAARAGAHRARSRGARTSIRCASACRSTVDGRYRATVRCRCSASAPRRRRPAAQCRRGSAPRSMRAIRQIIAANSAVSRGQ